MTPCEINVYGPYPYYGCFAACWGKVLRGKEFNLKPFDFKSSADGRDSYESHEEIAGIPENLLLKPETSTHLNFSGKADFVKGCPLSDRR